MSAGAHRGDALRAPALPSSDAALQRAQRAAARIAAAVQDGTEFLPTAQGSEPRRHTLKDAIQASHAALHNVAVLSESEAPEGALHQRETHAVLVASEMDGDRVTCNSQQQQEDEKKTKKKKKKKRKKKKKKKRKKKNKNNNNHGDDKKKKRSQQEEQQQQQQQKAPKAKIQ
eukprot:Skav219526  [mRNA]  locus=scaffold30:379733:383814:+ [translate_table: standard]